MCNRYQPTRAEEFYQAFKTQPPTGCRPVPVFPRGQGIFLWRASGCVAFERQVVVGRQWRLIPWFAKSVTLPYSTTNARIEGVAKRYGVSKVMGLTKYCKRRGL